MGVKVKAKPECTATARGRDFIKKNTIRQRNDFTTESYK